MTEYFSVNKFEEFQHYRDRRPPWIKLYTDLLDDFDFALLPDNKKGQLMSIWILASKLGNRIPLDNSWVAGKINATTVLDIDWFMSRGWLVPYDEETANGKFENWESRYVSKQTRERILERDGYKCVDCSGTINLEIDHILPISRGGDGADDNLQVLCRPCNRKKRAKTTHYEKKKAAEQDAPHMRSLETETEIETDKTSTKKIKVFEARHIKRCLEIWNKIMEPYAPKIKYPISDARKKHLTARIKGQLKTINTWKEYLNRLARSDFLTGRIPRSEDHKNWRPDFDWAIKRSTYDKVTEGKYDNEFGSGESKPLSEFEKALLDWRRSDEKGQKPEKSDYEG